MGLIDYDHQLDKEYYEFDGCSSLVLNSHIVENDINYLTEDELLVGAGFFSWLFKLGKKIVKPVFKLFRRHVAAPLIKEGTKVIKKTAKSILPKSVHGVVDVAGDFASKELVKLAKKGGQLQGCHVQGFDPVSCPNITLSGSGAHGSIMGFPPSKLEFEGMGEGKKKPKPVVARRRGRKKLTELTFR